MHQSPLDPPQPVLPKRSSSGPSLGAAQARSNPSVGLSPLMPASSIVGAGGQTDVIQGEFPAGPPRIAVEARRPGEIGALQPAMPPGNATRLSDHFALARSYAPGKPMAAAVRARMESLFAAQFGNVRIHEGPEAGAIGATAFVRGSSIYFAPGRYNPDTHQGQRLLAMQLAHVVQQRSGRVRNPFGSGVAVVNDPLLNAEAEMMGSRAAMALATSPAKGLKNRQHGSKAVFHGLDPILPGQPRQPLSSSSPVPSSQRANPGSALAPILPKRSHGGVLGVFSNWSSPAKSSGGAIVPAKPVQAKLSSAPILPKRAAWSFAAAVQPVMAVVSRGRHLWNSLVNQVGQQVTAHL